MKSTKDKTAYAIAVACLELLPSTGWAALDINDVARKAGVPKKTFSTHIQEKNDLIPLIVRFIDDETGKLAGRQDKNAPLEDRIFDVLMSRFEALQKYRESILLLADCARRTPELAHKMYHAQTDSMRIMLRWIHGTAKFGKNHFSPRFLLVLYHFVFIKWARDPSPEMPLTMASLNQCIRTKLVHRLFDRI